ncbi:MAG: HD domain-containing protein [Methanobacteriota archaeon]|nr:MAG: HD domain-containing protein [Euryarchaeota archaeon]
MENLEQKKGELIKRTANYVKKIMNKEATGHDWWHIYRVWKMAKKIAAEVGADMFIVEMAALLHDIDDYKVEGSGKRAEEWLKRLELNGSIVEKILSTIEEVSFKGALVKTETSSLEAAVVQDSDRLDALGAIGIARCFATGAKRNRSLYEPGEKPEKHGTFEEYKKSKGSSINHFYEKLLLLKDRMNTLPAKKIAEERHAFMEEFLTRFYEEWEGSE